MNNYYLGIDVSKGYSDFVMLNEKKELVSKGFQLDDTFIGHNNLYEFLSKFIKSHPDSEVYCGLESTGGYENNWYNSLSKFKISIPIHVTRLNPAGVSHEAKASLTRTITDQVSSRRIAEHLISQKQRIRYEETDYFTSIRRVWTYHQMLVKQKVQLLNQLQSMLYISNPEILIHCKNGVPGYIFHLLKRFPTAKLLSQAKPEELAKTPYIPRVLVSKLIENAKASVSSMSDTTTRDLIISMVEQIQNLEKTIDKQTELMEKECNLPEVEILMSYKGIGILSAVGLIIEIGAIERFSSVKKLASYFGLHPVFKSSGDGLSGIHMSKKGRTAPRAILYMVTLASLRHNPLIRELYKKHLAKGMNKQAAIGALMHKILRIVFGMLKNKTSFDPEIDRKNSQKVIVKKEKITKIKVRHMMDFDSKAPISRRQNKKRKEQVTSQNE